MTFGGYFAIVGGILTLSWVAASATRTAPAVKSDDDAAARGEPEALASAAGVGLAVYALARVLSSEENAGRTNEKTAIAWVVRNEAVAKGQTISEIVLRASGDAAGTFGQQSQGRFVSSARAPHAEDIAIARSVLASQGPDPTRGSRQFDHPRTQTSLSVSGATGYRMDADGLAQKRLVSNDLIVVAGIDPARLRFWRPRTGVA